MSKEQIQRAITQLDALMRIMRSDNLGQAVVTAQMFGDFEVALDALRKVRAGISAAEMGLQAYGDYEIFDHEPTEQEAINAAARIVEKMTGTIIARGTIRKSVLYDPLNLEWIVGIKIYMPNPENNKERRRARRVEFHRFETGEDGRLKAAKIPVTIKEDT